MSERTDLEIIAALVPPGSHVLDLGCGNGTLLALLRDQRGCTGYGVELDDAQVHECVQRGVGVIQRNLDEGLAIARLREFLFNRALRRLTQPSRPAAVAGQFETCRSERGRIARPHQ